MEGASKNRHPRLDSPRRLPRRWYRQACRRDPTPTERPSEPGRMIKIRMIKIVSWKIPEMMQRAALWRPCARPLALAGVPGRR